MQRGRFAPGIASSLVLEGIQRQGQKRMIRPLPPVEVLRARFSYDEITGELHWRSGWKTGRRAGGRNSTGYRMVFVQDQQYFEHRVIWKLQTGREPEFIDHIDGNRSNNAWSNLRSGSRGENMRNMRLNAASQTGVHGVRLWRGSWIARITYERRHIHLGSFYTKEEAVAARRAAEKCLGFSPTHGTSGRPHY